MTEQQLAAVKLALEALEYWVESFNYERDIRAITALRQALEQQPADEPVAYDKLTDSQIMASVGRCNAGISESRPIGQQWEQVCELVRHVMRERGYTRPQPAAWVDLTDQEIEAVWGKAIDEANASTIKKAINAGIRAIEAKLREKNGGAQ